MDGRVYDTNLDKILSDLSYRREMTATVVNWEQPSTALLEEVNAGVPKFVWIDGKKKFIDSKKKLHPAPDRHTHDEWFKARSWKDLEFLADYERNGGCSIAAGKAGRILAQQRQNAGIARMAATRGRFGKSKAAAKKTKSHARPIARRRQRRSSKRSAARRRV